MIMNWISRMRGDHNGSDATDALPEPGPQTGRARSSAPLIDSDETLVAEFGRARRYEQTLSIVVVSAVPIGDGEATARRADFLGVRRGPDVLPLLAGAGFREALRESDVLCYRPTDRLFVLGLPQTDTEAGRRAMERVGGLFRTRLRLELVVGVAEFPADGLTLEDLLEKARSRAQSVRTATERGRPQEPRARAESSGQPVTVGHRAKPPRASSATGLSHEAVRSE